MTNFKEYKEAELETKLDSLMNEDESWIDDCFGDILDGTVDWEKEKADSLKEREESQLKDAIKEYNMNPHRDYVKCGRCSGAGIIQHYKHVSGGVCFDCNGSRFVIKGYKICNI